VMEKRCEVCQRGCEGGICLRCLKRRQRMTRFVRRQTKDVQRYFSVDPGNSVGVGRFAAMLSGGKVGRVGEVCGSRGRLVAPEDGLVAPIVSGQPSEHGRTGGRTPNT
jgi:hypothetical protein